MARNYALKVDAFSRLNTVYMATRFVGGAAGATFGNFAWSAWGWPGVCAVCLVLSGAALLLQFMAPKMD